VYERGELEATEIGQREVDEDHCDILLEEDAERLGAGVRFEELVRDSSVDVSNPTKILELVEPYIVPAYRQKAQYAVEELWQLAR
jgi:hypothetical protein